MKSKPKNPTSTSDPGLPAGIHASDLKYPTTGNHVPYDQQKELNLDHTVFTFYYCGGKNGFGWVLCTLDIGGAGRFDTARTYGITMDGKVVRVGKGPHVTKVVEVYLSKDNLERLTPLIELWRTGMAEAGNIRDRISSRRAQGQIHRANGESSWRW